MSLKMNWNNVKATIVLQQYFSSSIKIFRKMWKTVEEVFAKLELLMTELGNWKSSASQVIFCKEKFAFYQISFYQISLKTLVQSIPSQTKISVLQHKISGKLPHYVMPSINLKQTCFNGLNDTIEYVYNHLTICLSI